LFEYYSFDIIPRIYKSFMWIENTDDHKTSYDCSLDYLWKNW